MSAQCCPTKSICIDPANPVQNFSTEAPDLTLFIGDNGGWDNSDGGYRLESMSWDALENVTYGTQDDEQSGEPIFWADWDSKIRVYPKPDEAYVLGVFYRAYQSELSADSDTPLMPLEWRTRLLVPYACSRLLRQEGGGEAASEADRYMAEYQKAFNDCRAACATIRVPEMRLSSPAWRDQMWMG